MRTGRINMKREEIISSDATPEIDTSSQNTSVGLFDSKQLEIYEGLRSIGPEISAFYLDGVRILNNPDLETKSYLLAHIAREIEGGLRDVLSCEKEKRIEQERIGNESKHIASIAVALGVDPNDSFVKKWHRIAKNFHGYAHRRGAMKIPREKNEFESWWKEFESLLFTLVGTYYSLLDRVDRILKYETPTKEILDTLPNLLETNARRSYFFRNLKSPKWLKPLSERGYFAPENNPQAEDYRVPYWSVLDYLESVATNNYEKPSEDITNLIVEIINSIVNYRNGKGERNENYRTDWKLMKILCQLPSEKIELQHIDFIGAALKPKLGISLVAPDLSDTFFQKLLKDKAKTLVIKLVNTILEYQRSNVGGSFDKYVPAMEEYWLNETLKKQKIEIAKLCGIDAAEIVLNKIKTIIAEDKTQFSNFCIHSIKESPQNLLPEKYEYQLVFFVRDMYDLSTADMIRDKIASLIKEEHSIFKRIALQAINHHYQDLNDLLWNWQGNPLDENALKPELYELFKTHCGSFNEKQVEKVLTWIESKKYYVSNKITDEEDKKRIVAYQKKEWLSSLSEAKNEKVMALYRKYQEINPERIDHPGFDFWTEHIFGASSTDLNVFLGKTNREIVEYLNNYSPKDNLRLMFYSDLSGKFETFVATYPEQISIDLVPFYKTHQIYQYALLSGISKAWREKKTFSIDNILQFAFKIIEPYIFWEQHADSHNNHRDWIISEIASLIEEGTREDEHAFDAELLPQAEKILLILAERTKSNLIEMKDLATAVLNSPKGRIFSAMINYSLRCTRLSKKDEGNRWVETIRADFDRRLEKTVEPSIEFSFILGEYLIYLHNLDKEWVIKNVNRIFPKDNNTHWEAAFAGYLINSGKVYKNLYSLMKENGHYAKAAETSFIDQSNNEILAVHACLAYVEGWEELDDETSLMYKLIKKGEAHQLTEIIHFFWRLRDKLNDKIRAKVKPIWKSLFERLSQDGEKPEYKRTNADLLTWLSLVDRIDMEVLNYLKSAVHCLQDPVSASFFIEYLLKHAVSEPSEVSELYIEMLNAGIYPDYKKENIEEVIRTLYEQGQKERADKICNMYGAKGVDFLRPIHIKYRSEATSY